MEQVLGPDTGDMLWWQMCLRGVVVVVFGLVLIRLFGRRAFGKQTALDIVLAIVVGSNLSRAITGNSPFLSTLAATAGIAFFYWLLVHLAARWGFFSRLVKGQPVSLGRSGALDRKAMRRAGISEGDVEEAARLHGVGKTAEIGQATLERNGEISAVRREG